MSASKLDRILAEIDALTAKELADGLRLALKAYRIKANRVKGHDRQWMRDQAARMAHSLLTVTTGGIDI